MEKDRQMKTHLRSENHKNYYRFCHGTSEPSSTASPTLQTGVTNSSLTGSLHINPLFTESLGGGLVRFIRHRRIKESDETLLKKLDLPEAAKKGTRFVLTRNSDSWEVSETKNWFLNCWSKQGTISPTRTRTPSLPKRHTEPLTHIREQNVEEWFLTNSVSKQTAINGNSPHLDHTTKIAKKTDKSLTTQSQKHTELTTRTAETQRTPQTVKQKNKLTSPLREKIDDINHQYATEDSNGKSPRRKLPQTPVKPKPLQITSKALIHRAANSHDKDTGCIEDPTINHHDIVLLRPNCNNDNHDSLPKNEISPQQRQQQCFEQQGHHTQQRDVTREELYTLIRDSKKLRENCKGYLQISQQNTEPQDSAGLLKILENRLRILKQQTSIRQQANYLPQKLVDSSLELDDRENSENHGTNPESDERVTNRPKSRSLEYTNQTKGYYTNRIKNMGALEDHERKVIIEFCHLLEKSKQLFNGLRELPQYGYKQWHSYFGRTFDVYTKLWKFQQQHRIVLDTKYRLKRWQIGEIASKIGQLYYHFYLRTSETAYLNEAFSFYSAIRGRCYYTKASKEDKCELMVKKLRYYARFIVVCLLLKKIKLVRDLIKELDRQIIEYGNTYDPDDQLEWTVVVDEVKAFLQAEPVVSVIHPDNYPVILSHRLSPLTTPPVERTPQMNLALQEVLIVGSSSQQVKFSELTMDMFRMLQTLERESTGDIQYMYDDSPRQRFNLTPSALNNKGYNLETGAPHSDNPHKYLLFKPSPSQILVYLASGCNDLPPNGALLLYISADGQTIQSQKHSEDGYDIGGLITTSKNELHRDGNKEKGSQTKHRELQCFHPGDLFPFTRRPLFVIVDSENSYVFQNVPRHFGQPLVILMSPAELPSSMHASTSDRRHQGNLFTLFLHSPLTAFCHCTDIHDISLVQWDRAQAFIDTFLAEASQLMTRNRIDTMFLNFMGDDFLRLLILRFIFCEVVLRMHRAFRSRSRLTRSSPAMADEVMEHPALTHIVMDLASHLQVRGNFHDPSAGPPPAKE